MIPGAIGWKCMNKKVEVVDFGSLNVLVVNDDNDDVVKLWNVTDDWTKPYKQVDVLLACCAQRSAPCHPDSFCAELEERRLRAEAEGQRLFTSGKDQPFVKDKYEATYKMLAQTEVWNCSCLGVGDAYCKDLAGLLQDFSLKTLKLASNRIGDEGVVALAKVLEVNTTVTDINLWKNQIGDKGGISALLRQTFRLCLPLPLNQTKHI